MAALCLGRRSDELTTRLLLSTASSLCLLSICSCRPADPAGGQGVLEARSASGVPMVIIPGGTFLMGSAHGKPDEAPPHEVTVSPFVMDTFEVTQDQLPPLAIPNPSQFKGPRRPVEQMRWSDAAEFCNARSRAEGLEPCYDEDTFACNYEASGYRLPTEAEWEYACRAGANVDSRQGFPGGEQQLRRHACYAGNSGKQTANAGSHRPNAWGLHDLYGNVSEWCQDVYSPGYYADSPSRDPRGPEAGKERILRGGAWADSAASCRATRRLHDVPGITDACFARNTYGFRCVRRPTAEEIARLAKPAER